MALFKKKKKEALTYVEAHNRAVGKYKKASFFLLWAGIVNFLSAIIGAFQSMSSAWPSSGYAMSFSVQILINATLVEYLDTWVAIILILLISAILGGLFCLLGAFAVRGFKVFLFVGIGLYLVDFACMFPFYEISVLKQYWNWTPYAFTLATHLVILIFLFIAVYYYFLVINIEKHKNNSQVDSATTFETKEETEVIAISEEESEGKDKDDSKQK